MCYEIRRAPVVVGGGVVGQNAQARQLYNASADTYYKANDAAAYDDWVRARNHWDYFYNRS
jgi:hypothetical protein